MKVYILFYAYTLWLLSALTSKDTIAQDWIQRADFGGDGRYFAMGFSIDDKGFLGLGIDSDLNKKTDIWAFDISTGAWNYVTTFPANYTSKSKVFSIGNKGYIAVDQAHGFWEYYPATDTWTQMANFPGSAAGAAAFSIGTKGYIVTGSYFRTLWEWDGDTASPNFNTWMEKAPFPPAEGRFGGVGFSIGNKGYFGTGTNGMTDMNDFWEWDGDTASPTYNTWTQKASLPSWERIYAVGFAIGEYGFIGTGQNGWNNLLLGDLWRWDQNTDTWTQMPDLPGLARQSAAAFSIGQSGYIGTGSAGIAGNNLKDFWEFCDTCFVQVNERDNSFDLILFPNPARDFVKIKSRDTGTEYQANLYDLYGRNILQRNVKKETMLNVSDLPDGIYLLTFSSKSDVRSFKIVVGH